VFLFSLYLGLGGMDRTRRGPPRVGGMT
jgi:hypothetical protein